MGGEQSTRVRWKCIETLVKNINGRGFLEYLTVDGRIILKWFFKN
jgi:hypothetical protein